MSDPISLSKVHFSEIELLQKVCAHVYAINFGSHWEKGGLEKYLQAQFGSERVHKDLENPDKLYYFIKYESQIVGFIKVCLHVGIQNYQYETTAELEKIYILPEFKGRGIGKKTMRLLIDILRESAVRHLFLEVLEVWL